MYFLSVLTNVLKQFRVLFSTLTIHLPILAIADLLSHFVLNICVRLRAYLWAFFNSGEYL